MRSVLAVCCILRNSQRTPRTQRLVYTAQVCRGPALQRRRRRPEYSICWRAVDAHLHTHHRRVPDKRIIRSHFSQTGLRQKLASCQGLLAAMAADANWMHHAALPRMIGATARACQWGATSPKPDAAILVELARTGQRDGTQPDARALAERLQEVAAAQGELTVELPSDFFASPQVLQPCIYQLSPFHTDMFRLSRRML